MLFHDIDLEDRPTGRRCNNRFFDMGSPFYIFLLALTIAVSVPLDAKAGEIDELKSMIRKMEQRHQKEMMQLRKQVEELIRKQPQTAENSDSKLDERVDKLVEQKVEEKLAKAEHTGFISPKNWQFDLGGELEFEFVKTQSESTPPGAKEPDAHFQIDQLYLYPKVKYKDFALFSADIDITGSTAFIEEAWTRFYGLPYNTWVEIGLNDQFIANIDRKSEAEILVETAFYRDDDMGVTIGGEPVDWLYWKASVTNGMALAAKEPSEDKSFNLIHDNRNTSNAKHLMRAVGVGFKLASEDYGKVDILPFYYNGGLSTADVAFLQAIPGYGASRKEEKTRYGFNCKYSATPSNV